MVAVNVIEMSFGLVMMGVRKKRELFYEVVYQHVVVVLFCLEV